MNLNFTFTTRDKILLLVLAVILFVGMMYLYGVMPANEEVEDLRQTAGTRAAPGADRGHQHRGHRRRV